MSHSEEALRDRPARILYLDYTNDIGLGGGQRSLALLLRHLDRGLYEPVLACPAGERLRDFLDPSIPVLDLQLDDGFRKLNRFQSSWPRLAAAAAGSLSAVGRLRDLILQRRFHLIHANNLKMLWLALAATGGLRIPILWHVRDIFPATVVNGTVCRLAAYGASRVVAVSSAVAAQFHGLANVRVLYNAVELPDLSQANQLGACFRSLFSIPADAFVIGYAGRLDPGKGLGTLVEAFASSGLSASGARLVIVGEGPEEGLLHALANRSGLGGSVHLIPYQSDIASVWASMDVCVQPSSQPDSFPRSVIEAMSYGLPVLGSRSGGIPEAILEGITGHCFSPGDAAQLSQLLQRLAPDRVLTRKMGAAGRNRCQQHYSASGQAEILSNLYQELLQERRRAEAA
jgi:glycosyltransferase involved in cell wall biosynthesis